MNIQDALREVGKVILALLIAMWICWLLSGCSPRVVTREVPVPVHDSIQVVSVQERVDTLWRYDTERVVDTLWLDTSTIATLGMPTLHHDRITERTSDKGKASSVSSSDTVFVEREIPVPITTTEIKEVNRLWWWQKALMWMGGIALVLGAAFKIYKAVRP